MAVVWPEPTTLEPSTKERPLELLCERSVAAAIGAWQPLLWDEARRCFAFHLPGALSPAVTGHFYQRLGEVTPWQTLTNKDGTRKSRQTAWYTRNRRCNCNYTYGEDIRVTPSSNKAFAEVMEGLLACVFRGFPDLPPDAWPDCANLNFYEDGTKGVGWHSDDELLFLGAVQDCPIMSLSLGGTREFWIAMKTDGAPDVRQGIVEVDLHDGDILTMEGLIQKHTMHLVPMANAADERRNQPRINVTFRWLRIHKQHCPLARYESYKNVERAFPEAVAGEHYKSKDEEDQKGEDVCEVTEPSHGETRGRVGDASSEADDIQVVASDDEADATILETQEETRSNPSGSASEDREVDSDPKPDGELQPGELQEVDATDLKTQEETCSNPSGSASEDREVDSDPKTDVELQQDENVTTVPLTLLDASTGEEIAVLEQRKPPTTPLSKKASIFKERKAVKNRAAPAARAFFGEGPRKKPWPEPHLCPGGGKGYIRRWAPAGRVAGAASPVAAPLPGGKTTKWQPCDACGHACWGGGRACQEGDDEFAGQWFCRCCWGKWAEADAAEASQDAAMFNPLLNPLLQPFGPPPLFNPMLNPMLNPLLSPMGLLPPPMPLMPPPFPPDPAIIAAQHGSWPLYNASDAAGAGSETGMGNPMPHIHNFYGGSGMLLPPA